MRDFFKQIQEVAASPTPRKDPAVATPGTTATNTYIPDSEKKAEPAAEAAKPATTEVRPAEPAKMSKEEAKASGKGSAHLITDGLETVLTVCELFRFVFSMSPEQKQQLELLQTKNVSDWTESDKLIMQQFAKQQSKHEKIKNSIAFKQADIDNIAESMAVYHEITGKKMSPGIIIASTIGKHLASKLTDMFL